MRIHPSVLSIVATITLISSSSLARTPDECHWGHMPTASESEACTLAEKHLTESAKTSVAHLEPLLGKRLLIPATEPRERPLFDWRALTPSLQHWIGIVLTRRENLTLEDFPEDLELRHCCYPPDEEGLCIFTADYVTWRWVFRFPIATCKCRACKLD